MASSAHQKRVVVCGGGIIGACIAYYLTERGVKPIIVERCEVACGASGKAGGFLALDWCDSSAVGNLARISFLLHTELSKKMQLEGYNTLYRTLDTLTVAASAKKTQKKAQRNELLPDWVNGDAIIGGASALGSQKTTAQVTPYLLTSALIDMAVKNGAQLRIGCIKGIEMTNDRVIGVNVDGEILQADDIVIAMGPWSGLAAQWGLQIPAVTGTKAHSIVLRPNAPVTAHALFMEYETAEGRVIDPEVYPRSNGEVYICGMSEDVLVPENPKEVHPREGACEKLVEVAANISTNLKDAPLEKAQACFLPVSSDGLPIIGKIPNIDGAYIATGHSCWGILNGPATGAAIAELLTTGTCKLVDLSPFDPSRFMK